MVPIESEEVTHSRSLPCRTAEKIMMEGEEEEGREGGGEGAGMF